VWLVGCGFCPVYERVTDLVWHSEYFPCLLFFRFYVEIWLITFQSTRVLVTYMELNRLLEIVIRTTIDMERR
jgi:hypothetical protein